MAVNLNMDVDPDIPSKDDFQDDDTTESLGNQTNTRCTTAAEDMVAYIEGQGKVYPSTPAAIAMIRNSIIKLSRIYLHASGGTGRRYALKEQGEGNAWGDNNIKRYIAKILTNHHMSDPSQSDFWTTDTSFVPADLEQTMRRAIDNLVDERYAEFVDPSRESTVKGALYLTFVIVILSELET